MGSLLFLLALLPLPILSYAWGATYRKLTRGAMEYVGENFNEVLLTIAPRKSVKVGVEGRCAIVVEGANSWVTIRLNGGPREKVFKLRLLNFTGELELINESFALPCSLRLRSTGPIRRGE
ncbi:hypothetical protein HS1genome_0480 [Sulfodiicoccus acidiphilus]|uniref:Uncharacterized protein n=1 Tax=Sulfodiicoccus acidiphilus TaxID=1670455 RepID=A0A348B1N9_9CREN|nr:hypothetical protein [Sulfodiicoccus acidiphilus]BBD72091.1 hypothetical protein HS1genome_0480 [Sulfodiicoccus acidiphilus]GGU05086.1 hypothetical protein GCM10007116_22020 [Sulfodiicoccus acidiphilus]